MTQNAHDSLISYFFLFFIFSIFFLTELCFAETEIIRACSKLTIETLEQGVKYVQS